MPPSRPQARTALAATPRPPMPAEPSLARPAPRWRPALPLVVALVLVLLGISLGAALSPPAFALGAIGLVALGLDVALGRPRRLLGLFDAPSAAASSEPRLFNLLEGLCVTNGLAIPEVRVLEDDAANAVMLWSTRGRSAIVVTRGLLDALDRIGLEAVLAHALAMDKTGAAAAAARLRLGLGALWWWPEAQARLAWSLSDPARLAVADHAAVAMTRYPPGLRGALELLAERETTPRRLGPEAVRLTAGDWLIPLRKPPAVRRFELDLELRVAALAEL